MLGMVEFLSVALATGCLNAPLAWSPDGRWLAYTTVHRSDGIDLPPGWLHQPEPELTDPPGDALPADRRRAGTVRYRIWATDRESRASVLIEDSLTPLSSPSWGPDGHSLTFLRYAGPPGADGTSTCQVVMQEALERKRVLATLAGLEVDADEAGRLPEVAPAWSPDGRYLAVSRPGRGPAVLIVLPEQGRVLKTFEGVRLPSWAPDGSKLVVLREPRGGAGERTVEVIGHDLGAIRPLLSMLDVSEPPAWSPDGQSILVAGLRAQGRLRDLELVRVHHDSGAASRLLSLGLPVPLSRSGNRLSRLEPAPPLDGGSCRVWVGFDREQDQCAFALDIEGQTPVIGLGQMRQPIAVLKKFHPLDLSLKIGRVAFHPDARVVAVRIDTAGPGDLPLLYELGSDIARLLTPDKAARQEWLATLVVTARGLMRSALPRPNLQGRVLTRPYPLPIPGELAEHSPVHLRLKRLGRTGRALLDQPTGNHSGDLGDDEVPGASDDYRLFFDYLRQDYAAAEADLDALEGRDLSRQARLRLLVLRVQILMAQGRLEQPRPMLEYLLTLLGAGTRQIEETPLGPAFSDVDDPAQLWVRYLSHRLEGREAAGRAVPGETSSEAEDVPSGFPRMLHGWRSAIPAAERARMLRGDPDPFDPGFGLPRRQFGEGPFGPAPRRPGDLQQPLRPPQPPPALPPGIPRSLRPALRR